MDSTQSKRVAVGLACFWCCWVIVTSIIDQFIVYAAALWFFQGRPRIKKMESFRKRIDSCWEIS